jgi:acyl-CoA thioesterase FadM
METAISYKKPLLISDSVRAELWLSELAKISAWMQFRFLNQNGELAAFGSQRGVFINYATGKPQRLTSEERALFEPYLQETNGLDK